MKNVGIAEIIAVQVHLFLINVVYGILLGIWYEFFRTLRKNFAHKDKIVHLEDIIFCVTASLGIFILFQVYNQGIVRFYCLMGLECGILFYFFICSKWIGRIIYVFVNIFSKIMKKIGNIVFFPVKLIMKNVGKMLKNMRRTIKIIRKHK